MTADYTTAEAVRQYKSFDEDGTDDARVEALITQASRLFDKLTHRDEGAYCVADEAASYRYYDGYERAIAHIDEAVSISEVAISEDGETFTAWAESDYWKLDADGLFDRTPYVILQVADGSEETDFGSGRRSLRVKARWGYSTAVPDDVALAVLRMTTWAYDLASGQAGQNSPLVTEYGIVLAPAALPDDVKATVLEYRRKV